MNNCTQIEDKKHSISKSQILYVLRSISLTQSESFFIFVRIYSICVDYDKRVIIIIIIF